MLTESLNWIFASTWEFVYISKKWNEDRWNFDHGTRTTSSLLSNRSIESFLLGERIWELRLSLRLSASFFPFLDSFSLAFETPFFFLATSLVSSISLVIISSFLFFFFLLLLSFVLQGGEDQIMALIDWLRRMKLEQKRIEMKFLTRNRTKLPFSKPWASNSIVLMTALIHPYPLFHLLLFFLLFPPSLLISFQPFSFFSLLTELYTIHHQDEPYTFSLLKTIIPKRT